MTKGKSRKPSIETRLSLYLRSEAQMGMVSPPRLPRPKAGPPPSFRPRMQQECSHLTATANLEIETHRTGFRRIMVSSHDLKQVKVVIVEDNPETRGLLSRFLTRQGARVIEAGDPTTALRAIQQCHPNVVLSDIGLPQTKRF